MTVDHTKASQPPIKPEPARPGDTLSAMHLSESPEAISRMVRGVSPPRQIIGRAINSGIAFPVTLTQTGGAQGSDTAIATWTYTVSHAITGIQLATEVSPVADPHKWQRPSVGWIIAATFGYAHYNTSGALVIGWLNEIPDQEACPT